MPLDPLAQQTDVEDNLGRTLTAGEITRASTLLNRASQLIRSYTGLTFTLVTDDVAVMRITAGRVRLPQRPVTAVSKVALVGYDGVQRYTVPFIWDGLDEVTMFGDYLVLNLPEILHDVYTHTAEITYSHGYATVPDDIRDLTAEVVARVYQSPSTPGVQYQTAGPFSVRVADGYGSGQVVLTDADKQLLDDGGYRRGAFTVGML